MQELGRKMIFQKKKKKQKKKQKNDKMIFSLVWDIIFTDS